MAKKRAPTFDEFVVMLKSGEILDYFCNKGRDYVIYNFIGELEQNSNFLYLNGYYEDCNWYVSEKKNGRVTAGICDEAGTTKIKVFAYIVGGAGEKHKAFDGTYVMSRATNYQGKGMDDDLDDIYVYYKKRDGLTTRKEVERKYESLLKDYEEMKFIKIELN